MKPASSDPKNHVPPVCPGDDWDDADGLNIDGGSVSSGLPRRRIIHDKSAARVDASSQVGLRIGGNVERIETLESTPRLEVQEYTPSVIRLDEPVEAPPKVVAQVVFHEKPERPKTNRLLIDEGRDWGGKHKISTRWAIGLVVGITSLVTLCIFLLPKINAPNAHRTGSSDKMLLVQDAEPDVVIENLDFLANKKSEALGILERYWRATQVSEILPLLRESEKLADLIGQHWKTPQFLANSGANFSIVDSTWEAFEVRGNICGVLRLELPDSNELTAYFVREKEELRMDWKATFAFGTASFDELTKGRGTPKEVRGIISRAQFYNNFWPESDYCSYRFQSPIDRSAVWVYSQRDGHVSEALMTAMGSGEITAAAPEQKITLHLARGPDGTAPNQWFIQDVVQPDWLAP